VAIPKTRITGAMYGPSGAALTGPLTVTLRLNQRLIILDDTNPALWHAVETFPVTFSIANPAAVDFYAVPTGSEQARVSPTNAYYNVSIRDPSGTIRLGRWVVADSPTPGMQNLREIDPNGPVEDGLATAFLSRLTGGTVSGRLILAQQMSMQAGKPIRWLDDGGVEIFRLQVVGGALKVIKDSVTELASWQTP